jgi:spectinomycin phosphotransferase
LREKIKVERLSPRWRERARAFQQQAEQIDFTDPAAAALTGLMRERREEIRHVIARAEALAQALRGRALEPVLCHGDLHAYNLLITPAGDFYIVDWDDPILAARERDLMFIGAGIGGIWNTEREESAFYRGYGAMKINRTALAYYRYERIVEVKGGIVEVRYRRVGVDELDRRLAMVEQVQYPFG